jgi:SAM-dependent methyltransferase
VTELLYGPDGPSEQDLRLVGDVAGKRVLQLGCGDPAGAVALAQQGAVVIAVDSSSARLARARSRAEAAEVRVEFREGDLADLAFLRADSVDVVVSVLAIDTLDDSARAFRQVQRVLKPNAPFVFSQAHPFALCVDDGRIARSYLEPGPVPVTRGDEELTAHPRTVSGVFTDLFRAGFRVDTLVEPKPGRAGSGPERAAGTPPLPSIIVWRARKEGT